MRLDPFAKLLRNGDRVKSWLETGKSIPILAEIAPTGYCNASELDCPWCSFKNSRESRQISSKTMIRVLEDIAKFGIKAINWTGGGEPTIHPNFGEFVRSAQQNGLKQGLFTNGFTKIPEQEAFEWIRISLTRRNYKAIKRPEVPFGICLNQTKDQSADELRKLCSDARDFGAVYFQVRPALANFYETQSCLETPEFLKEYETDQFEVYVTPYKYKEYLQKRAYSKCFGYFFCPSINWRGQLGVCLYLMMLDGKFMFGDLNNENFSEIWSRIPDFIDVIPECQICCKNHEINRGLFAAKNVEQAAFL
jgi:organic radical activating enzyme